MRAIAMKRRPRLESRCPSEHSSHRSHCLLNLYREHSQLRSAARGHETSHVTRCPHGRRDCRHRSRAGGDERRRRRSRPRRAACAILRGSNPCLRPCRSRGPVPSRPTCPSAPRATEQYPSRARRHRNERDLDHALCLAWLPGLRDISVAFRNRTYADARLRTGMCFLPQSFSPTSAGAKSRPFSDSRYSYRSGRCEYAFLSRTP